MYIYIHANIYTNYIYNIYIYSIIYIYYIYIYIYIIYIYIYIIYTVEWLIFHVTIFPNFSFLGVSVSNISEKRTYVFFRF